MKSCSKASIEVRSRRVTADGCRSRCLPALSGGVITEPGGFQDISRWLSGATPPDNTIRTIPAPQRGARPSRKTAFDRTASWHPSGMPRRVDSLTGGVASLNHRLMSDIPPGCMKGFGIVYAKLFVPLLTPKGQYPKAQGCAKRLPWVNGRIHATTQRGCVRAP